LFVNGRGELWLIYVIAALYGASGAFLFSARSAFMTVMLPRDLLADANAIFATIREGLRLIAPLAGAGLYAAFGGGVVAVLDASTFAAVAAAIAFVRTPEPRPVREEHRFLTELAAGARHIFATAPLRQIILTAGVCLLVVGFAETFVFAVVDQGLHREPSFLGVLESLQGAGAVLGGVTAARALRYFGDVRLVGIGMVLFALGDGTFALPSLPLVASGFAVAGFGLAWLIVGFSTSVQVRTPQRLQGRVASAAGTIIGVPQTFSIALGASLIGFADYRVLVGIMAVVMTGCAAYLLTRGPEPVVAEIPEPEPAIS
jgi:hypothetical protein